MEAAEPIQQTKQVKLDKKTKFVVLDDSVIKGYILNVLGTDQIHDFCDVKRLDKLDKDLFPKTGGGRQICMNVPDKDEYVDAQCLETFHVFLETIFEDGMVYKYLNDLSGGGRHKQRGPVGKTHVYEKIEFKNLYTKKDREDVIPKSEKDFIDEIKKRCKKFYNYKGNHKLGNLKNICTNNIVKIYKIFNENNDVRQNNVFTVFNNVCKTYYEKQYGDVPVSSDDNNDRIPSDIRLEPEVESPTQYESVYSNPLLPVSPLIENEISDQGQHGGDGFISQNLKIFIRQMAFTFCQCEYTRNEGVTNFTNWNSWKNKHSIYPNWFYFEKMLLMYSSTIEDHSRDWVNELIKGNQMTNIEYLKGINDGDKIVCNYKPKVNGKTIINNSANISSYWNDYILDTYPSFIDSQTNGGTKYTEWGTYNCGFRSENSKYYYSIKLSNPKILPNYPLNTIKIYFGGNSFEQEVDYSDYGLDIKSWKKVSASIALAKAFNNVYSVKREKTRKMLTWNDLINEVKVNGAVNTTIKNFYKFSLFKGLGDISQEMSALIINAGRENNSGQESHIPSPRNNNFVNKSRFYLANDKLSANRYILTMNYGLKNRSLEYNNNINIQSYGGFFNVFGCKDYNFYLVEPDLSVPAVPVPSVLPAAPMDDVRGGNNKTKKKRNTKKKHLKNYLKKSKTRKR